MLFSKGHFLLKVKKYFRENLGAPFVIGFQMLLLVCASLLIMDSSMLANEVAVYAYYLLVIGVVLQLFSFLRHRKGRAEEK
jgi:hypothetical protein